MKIQNTKVESAKQLSRGSNHAILAYTITQKLKLAPNNQVFYPYSSKYSNYSFRFSMITKFSRDSPNLICFLAE